MATVQVRSGALEQVRKLLKARSEEELAARLGVSRETLRRVECGIRPPSPTFMAGVCVATNKGLATWFEVSR